MADGPAVGTQAFRDQAGLYSVQQCLSAAMVNTKELLGEDRTYPVNVDDPRFKRLMAYIGMAGTVVRRIGN